MENEVLDGINAMLRAGELSLADDPLKARPIFEAMFAEVPKPEGVSIEPGKVGEISGLWLKPKNAPADKVVLYLHGGGYVIGSANAYSTIAGGLAQMSGLNMFLADYRLAPESPYPAATDDVLACYRGLLTDNYKQVVVAGDSAGGGLVMSLLLSLREQELPQPSCAILWSPWLDLELESKSIDTNADLDPTLDKAGLQACVKHYVGEQLPKDEILHPLTSDLSNLAPLLIQVGSTEVLLDDALALANVASQYSTYCQLEVWPGMPHVFQGFAPVLTDATQAIENTNYFIQQFAKEV